MDVQEWNPLAFYAHVTPELHPDSTLAQTEIDVAHAYHSVIL